MKLARIPFKREILYWGVEDQSPVSSGSLGWELKAGGCLPDLGLFLMREFVARVQNPAFDLKRANEWSKLNSLKVRQIDR